MFNDKISAPTGECDKYVAVKSLDKESIKGRIFEVRGIKVMIDADIAMYFGVETGSLNRAMKRNINRFPESFCFQLTREEYMDFLRCQNGILELQQGKYSKYCPFVYSEQGVAMLTSVLHTDRAVKASILIIEVFVEMSHLIRQNTVILPERDVKFLSVRQDKLQMEIDDIKDNIKDNMVTKSDLSDFMKLFDTGLEQEEILILDGEPFKADVAYQKIYGRAKRKIVVIDDYISSKTLQHLAHSKPNISVNVISDNKGRHPLRLSEYMDFQTEYPGRSVIFTQTVGKVHDRYIILDHGRKDVRVYHCGASSKDAGKRITTITRLQDITGYGVMVTGLLGNPGLVLK